MATGKYVRVTVVLECSTCDKTDVKVEPGVSRYITQKNRQNSPDRLELRKFCHFCGKHTIHVEMKH
uniref:ribosomal protein L33 n=1 Tax=Medicago rigiduloides TaxID=66817 RepID=UPI00226C712F|nr:ribosomal protein L33 [Medicago rigiduloides]UZC32413.1 ribosomal protein L33 [Medicago rigiduloides]UZC32489.1 ribosomal protein L33 [Medicago rigiduloides]